MEATAPPAGSGPAGSTFSENPRALTSPRAARAAAIAAELTQRGLTDISFMDEPASGPTTASSPQAPPPRVPSDCPPKRLLRATGADGKRLVVHVYDLPPQELHGATPGAAHTAPATRHSGSNPSHEGVRADPLEAVVSRVLKPLMRSISLVFPHFSTATSLLRTPSALCVLAEYANGGSLFGMVRRGSAAGLPTPAAAFLFQQLTVTAHFGRGVGLWLHRVRPAKLLVAWNDKAMPIVKVNVVGYDWPDAPDVSGGVPSVQEAEMEDDAEATAEAEASDSRGADQAQQGDLHAPNSRIKATVLTPPHVLRAAALREGAVLEEAAVAEACTVWALAVSLHFLRFGRWPFSQDQIRRWAVTPAAEWRDDVAVQGRMHGREGVGNSVALGAGHPGAVAQGMDNFAAAVFRCGRMAPADFARNCPTLDSIMHSPWWLEGLPDGALEMTATYATKTAEWGASSQLAAARQQVEALLIATRAGGGGGDGGAQGEPASLWNCMHMAALQLGPPLRSPHGRGRRSPNDTLRPAS